MGKRRQRRARLFRNKGWVRPPEWEKWLKYRNKNEADGDCQLVSAVNAYFYLTGKVITPRRYERLLDLGKCRYGSALQIKKVWRDLRIKVGEEASSVLKLMRGRKSREDILPLEIYVWHKNCGHHSILAVGWEPRTSAWQVTNFRNVASTEGWIFDEDLHQFQRSTGKGWECRTFVLRGK